MHWWCTGKPGRARDDPSFKCKRCLGDARATHVQANDKIYADGEPLESVDSCYLGDMLSGDGGCESAVITRGRTAWGKYRDLLPILSSKNVALRTKGRVYDICIRSAMLYGSETWARRNTTDLDRLQRNEREMLRRICRVRPNKRVGSAEMCRKLGIGELRPAISQR